MILTLFMLKEANSEEQSQPNSCQQQRTNRRGGKATTAITPKTEKDCWMFDAEVSQHMSNSSQKYIKEKSVFTLDPDNRWFSDASRV